MKLEFSGQILEMGYRWSAETY